MVVICLAEHWIDQYVMGHLELDKGCLRLLPPFWIGLLVGVKRTRQVLVRALNIIKSCRRADGKDSIRTLRLNLFAVHFPWTATTAVVAHAVLTEE